MKQKYVKKTEKTPCNCNTRQIIKGLKVIYNTSSLFSLHNTCKYAMMMTLKSIKLPIFIYPIISELNVSSVCLPVYLVVYVYSTLYTKVEKLPGVLERSHFLSDSEEKIKKREDNGRTRLVEEYVFNVAARGR